MKNIYLAFKARRFLLTEYFPRYSDEISKIDLPPN